MKDNVTKLVHSRVCRAAATVLAIGAVSAGAVHATPSRPVVVIPPEQLPATARQTGEAMLLHETVDGRLLLYIEQNQGARLATLDVTDPLHIKDNGFTPLIASGSFDFVSPLGNQAELVRFRQGQGDAVLDLPRVRAPKLLPVQMPTLLGPVFNVGSYALSSSGPTTQAAASQRFMAIDTVLSYELNRVLDVKQVLAQMTRPDTGTTFMLTEKGLYVVRRPAIEWIHQSMIVSPN